MDYKAIINIMKEMNQTDLTKLEIEQEGIHILMEKGYSAPAVTQNQIAMPQVNAGSQVIPTILSGIAAGQQTVISSDSGGNTIEAEGAKGKTMKAPMVGTFYSKPSPDRPPFVKIGDKVKKGQTVCIIEAMKLMNEIESEYDGEIIELLVKDEEMVEYGQPLFVIKEC